MTKCGECGHEISTTARACPSCGAARPRTKWWLWVPLGLVAAFVVFAAILPNKPGRFDAERVVSSLLKDPDSATFNGPFPGRMDSDTWCGSVNAKNGFGGYVGDRFFFVRFEAGKLAEIWLESRPGENGPEGWWLNCKSS